MDLFRRHPRFERVSEYADGTLAATSAARVASHLESCARCRREVAMIRETDEALREVPVPGLPDDMFERILRRREADVRTLVPDAPVFMPRRSWKSIAVAAGVVILAAFAGIAVTSRAATAGASHLRLAGAEPGFRAEYLAGSALAGERLVRVRAKVWSRDAAASYIANVGVLQRSDDEFVGDIRLPPDAAYVLLAVESLDGEVVDLNGGGFWEYESNAADPAVVARARLDALLEMGQSGVALATPLRIEAIEATERFPDEVALWNARAEYELAPGGDPAKPAILEAHRLRLDEFAARALDGPATVENLAAIAKYAATLRVSDVGGRIVEELAAVDPAHPVVLRDRVLRTFESGGDPLPRLEEAFSAAADADGFLATMGYDVSLATGDPALILRWADRLASRGPLPADETAAELAGLSAVRGEGIERIRRRLAFYGRPPETLRPLHRSREGWEAELRRRRAGLNSALGHALLAEGDASAGLAALRRSIAERWDPGVASALFRSAPRPIDPDIAALARLALADPTLEDVPFQAPGLSSDELLTARRELIDRIEVRSRTGDVPAAAFRSRVGTEVSLDDGGITFIALWQAPPVITDPEVHTLVRNAPPLARAGIRTLVGGPEQWLDDLVEIADLAGARAVVDPDGEVTAGFGGRALWEYVIVHDGWYSVHHDLEEATRLALLHSEIR